MDLEFERCKDAYRFMGHKGVCKVTDTKIIQFVFEDSNGKPNNEGVSRIKLWEGSYAMGPTKLKCLIYKIQAEKKAQVQENEPPSEEKHQNNEPASKAKEMKKENFSSFLLLKNFRHHAVITLQNFYSEVGQGRVVLSWVDCTLKDYAKSESVPICGQGLSPLFRTCVMYYFPLTREIACGLEALLKANLYPTKITIHHLFVRKVCLARQGKLLVLEADGKELVDPRARKVKLWKELRGVISDICNITHVTSGLSPAANRFINYIGRNTSMLQDYPDSWSYDKKARYLLSIISADMGDTVQELKDTNLAWPLVNQNIPTLLDDLIKDDKQRDFPSNYKKEIPFDYLRLCRTVIKHFPSLCKRVPLLKVECPKRNDFIKKMEEWRPDIFCVLYEKLGWPH